MDADHVTVALFIGEVPQDPSLGCKAPPQLRYLYRTEVAAAAAKSRQKQRSKLTERLAKRQQQLDKKHLAQLEAVAPQAAQLAEQQSEERAALAELQRKLTATQEELAAEKAKHQASLDALAAKHDEELRMQKVCFQHSRHGMSNVYWL